ncbi:MAG: hypothetical protein ACTSVF_00510 [Candidatus Asgardarchaeia archaeon]
MARPCLKGKEEPSIPSLEENILQGCPCLTCKDLEKCGIGHEKSPLKCKKFNEWLDGLLHLER